jgi:ectoine hydroxylase-related dioxygenase (phytanoyl-CoA dioxygenase family)
VLDTVNMWWTTAFGTRPDSSAAQLWHFDMDRLRWIKFFVYLTDVTLESGPHCFVAGSHRTGGIPQDLRDLGYARITDDVVDRHYPREAIKEFVAPRGSILAEDTRGLHKGKPAIKGDRLMLEFEFSNSLFGGNPVHAARLTEFRDAQFERFVGEHRRLLQRWIDS